MASITPTVVPGDGYVRVEVNFQDFPHARRVNIWRSVGGVDTLLRDGSAAWLSNGIAVAFDHEAPLDTPLIYKATAALNYNPTFEDGVTEWTDATNSGTVGTATQSYDYYQEGNASLKLAPSGAAISRAVSEFIPATAGTSYTASAWLMVSDYWTAGIGVQIHWFNGTTFLSTSGTLSNITPAPGVFELHTLTATAPATTTQAKLVAAIQGSPPSTGPLRFYVDEAYLSTPLASITTATPVTVPSTGGGWWTDPLHPATKVRLQVDLTFSPTGCSTGGGIAYLGVSEETFAADTAMLDINDAQYPVGVWNRRKAGRQTIRVGTETLADLARVNALLAPGAPVLLQLNAAYGEADAYQLLGDATVNRINGDQRVQVRIVDTPFGKVRAPYGPAEGTLKTRYVDITKYTTFAAATTAGATWLDVLRGNA